MNRLRLLCSAILLLAAAPLAARAQDTTGTPNLARVAGGRTVQLTLRDGSSVFGRVLEVTPSVVRFSSALGESSIPRASIVSVRVVGEATLHGGEYWPEDPSRTRLFFAPTGRMLRAGEMYFADAYVFFPSIQGGVSDRFTIGAGMSVFPGVSLEEQAYYVTPKVGVYSSPKVNIAVGALIAGARGLSEESPAGIVYGVGTLGGEDASVTLGSGFGFSRTTTSSTALIMLGGSRRVSKSVALVSENYFVTASDAGALLSGGVRFMSERIAVDVAAVGGSFDAIVPYVAFIYRW